MRKHKLAVRRRSKKMDKKEKGMGVRNIPSIQK